MSKYYVGDHFDLEICKEFKDENGNIRYQIRGFNSLMFDEQGLDKLKKLTFASKDTVENGYKEGIRDVFSILEYYSTSSSKEIIEISKSILTDKSKCKDLLADMQIKYIKVLAKRVEANKNIFIGEHLEEVTPDTKLSIGDEIYVRYAPYSKRQRAIITEIVKSSSYFVINIFDSDREVHAINLNNKNADFRDGGYYKIEKTGKNFAGISDAMHALNKPIVDFY